MTRRKSLYRPEHLLRLVFLVCGLGIYCLLSSPGWAAVDPYVARYLRVTAPIDMPLNSQGQTTQLTPIQLSQGKQLFEQNCLNCHVGGATLPNPLVSLSLQDLKSAHPPRDTISSLMAFQRNPRTHDGTEATLECRRVSPQWLDDQTLRSLAGFLLRAAQIAPGWGTERFNES